MPKESTLYQTLENRDDADRVENEGPFRCITDSAWLGHGYYFWDYHIKLSHWWGKTRYGNDKYIICRCNCIITDDNCWDLHNNGEHQAEFAEALGLISKARMGSYKRISVAQIIEYIKIKGFFNYEAIRASGINSVKEISNDIIDVGRRVEFNSGHFAAYYEIYPPIQLCLLTKTSLSLSNYKIIFPDYLIEQSVF